MKCWLVDWQLTMNGAVLSWTRLGQYYYSLLHYLVLSESEKSRADLMEEVVYSEVDGCGSLLVREKTAQTMRWWQYSTTHTVSPALLIPPHLGKHVLSLKNTMFSWFLPFWPQRKREVVWSGALWSSLLHFRGTR
eukprot:scaffold138_cov178-Ochromonas_danica.AAC.7